MTKGFFKDTPLKTSLRKQFNGCPPFSILNAREGGWQRRKQQWIKLGIQSELGRGETEETAFQKTKGKGLAQSTGQDLMRGEHKVKKIRGKQIASIGDPPMPLDRKKGYGAEKTNTKFDGKTQKALGCYMAGGGAINKYGTKQVTGTSIFDPVLTELMYNWFCPKEGHILDPFAGGSVRGIVAGTLNRDYTGIDLSKNQIKANQIQAEKIQPEKKPTWIAGESFNVMAKQLSKEKFDFILTCPPYHDLELYSEDPDDLSNMSYSDFVIAYSKIIKRAVYLLKENRFACFVVGEVRAKDGSYKGFVVDTVAVCIRAGLSYYNEAILITAVGSLPIRIVKQFKSGRKLGKTHQNILIFYKGDVSKIKNKYGK